MQAQQNDLPSACRLAVAVFTDPSCLHDAVSDLREAGIHEIAIAFSAENIQRRQTEPKAQRAYESFLHGDRHTVSWRLRHGIEHDLHRKGAEIMAGEGKDHLSPGTPYEEINLAETLSGIGVSADRIDLINREVGCEGALLLVNAGDFLDEVQSILEKDCGINRTETATERASSAA
jgi:hypothetical protein